MNQDVRNCARCGGNHPVATSPESISGRQPLDAGGRSWQFCAPCPSNGEPIMMQVTTAADRSTRNDFVASYS